MIANVNLESNITWANPDKFDANSNNTFHPNPRPGYTPNEQWSYNRYVQLWNRISTGIRQPIL